MGRYAAVTPAENIRSLCAVSYTGFFLAGKGSGGIRGLWDLPAALLLGILAKTGFEVYNFYDIPKTERKNSMKIAVTYENGQIFQHFGHTKTFKVYEVEEGKILSSQVVDTNGSGHGALAGVLSMLHADVLICGGIGGGAQMALAAANIKLYGGVSGDADAAVAAFLAGELDYDPNARCDHHDHHGEGHTCGDHGCGSHSCGHH